MPGVRAIRYRDPEFKVRPLRPGRIQTPDELVRALGGGGFQGRKLSLCADVWEAMCREEDCLKVVALSGAMVPAGMAEVLCELIEARVIDAIVSTGANVTHDFVNAVVDQGHYLGSEHADDDDLHTHKVNRVFDIFMPDEGYDRAEEAMWDCMDREGWTERTVPPSEFTAALGRWAPRRCLLKVAAQNEVPIYVPAISDSEIGIDVLTGGMKRGHQNRFDELQDIVGFGERIRAHAKWGILILGGGVPRNWAQQIFPYLEDRSKYRGEPKHQWPGYTYGVQITTDRPDFGGLSGCTFDESKSWGKYHAESRHASVICDVTIALPLLATALLARLQA